MFKILIFLFLTIEAFAYINITPITFDERIDREGGAKEYILSNSSKKNKRYRIYVESTEEIKDMTDWVEWYPKSVSLKSGESKKIKVLITAPDEAKRGEYTTKLCIKELETPTEKENVNILTNLKIELAGYVGDIKPKLTVEIKNKDAQNKEFVIKNTGEIRRRFEIYTGDNEKDLEYLEQIRLFKGDTKNITIPKKNIKKIIIIKDQTSQIIWKKILKGEK